MNGASAGPVRLYGGAHAGAKTPQAVSMGVFFDGHHIYNVLHGDRIYTLDELDALAGAVSPSDLEQLRLMLRYLRMVCDMLAIIKKGRE